MVFQLAYVSTATTLFERSELLQLLSAARTRNAADDITGALLHRHGRFLQLLEGPAPAVGRAYRSIITDHRHTDVRCLWTAHGATRCFSEWTMGFRDLTDDPLVHPGYVNLLTDTTPAQLTGRALQDLWELLQPTAAAETPPAAGDLRPPTFAALRDNLRRGLARAPRSRSGDASTAG